MKCVECGMEGEWSPCPGCDKVYCQTCAEAEGSTCCATCDGCGYLEADCICCTELPRV